MISEMVSKRIVIGWLTAILLAGGLYPAEESDKENPKAETRPVPVLKVIPGLFQLKSGKIVKGSLLLATFAAAVAGTIIENHRGNDTYRRYLASTDVAEIIQLRRATEDHFQRRNYYIGGLVGIWLVHLLDLKLSAYSQGKKKGGIQSEVSKDSITVGLYYSF